MPMLDLICLRTKHRATFKAFEPVYTYLYDRDRKNVRLILVTYVFFSDENHVKKTINRVSKL